MYQKKIISDQIRKSAVPRVLRVRFLFCKAQLIRTNALCILWTIMVSVPKCPGKYFISQNDSTWYNQGMLVQISCAVQDKNRTFKTRDTFYFLTWSKIIFFWNIRYLPLLARDRRFPAL